MYLHDLAWFAKNDVYGNTWNFGQVSAITVWVPPIVEYIHLEMRGMQRAFDHRLLPPYKISKTQDTEHDQEVNPNEILPMNDGQYDLETGNKESPRPIELVTPISASSATPLSYDDEDIGKATLTQDDDLIDEYDIAHQDRYTASHDHHPTEQPDSMILLQPYDDRYATGNRDTERLLPPLDFSCDGPKFSSISF
ncbi:MAG: hypothetical protein L6R42_008209 [Xanthoria sp. 1 TBL-2021]|nr:MAG: hypothetical protein L6R42_008209 [Xanthoria sp. 1 TBL-2021]